MILYIVLGIIALLFFGGIRIVRPTHRAVIERLGSYKRFAKKGFNWIIPVIDRMIQVNITEQMMDVKPQDIITKDNLNARVDLVVFYKVREDDVNVKKSIYSVDNFEKQIVIQAQTTTRNVIGDKSFVDVNSKRKELNTALKTTLDKISDRWGVEVVRVELKEITPPDDVQDSMNRVIKAENEKDAAVDLAKATETNADGEKKASIKKAEGIRDGKKIVADGEAYRIKTVNDAARKHFTGNAQKLKSLEVTQASLENNSKIILTEKGIKPQLIIGNLPITSKKK